MSYGPEQQKRLSEALTANISFHRTVALVTRHVHDKPDPDLESVQQLIIKAERWLLTWENARQHAAANDWYGCPLVEKYFRIPLRTHYERLQTTPAWARQIIAEGGVPKIDDDMQYVMRYDPVLFHEENTRTLAHVLGMSLD